jgi:hypothetical protein
VLAGVTATDAVDTATTRAMAAGGRLALAATVSADNNELMATHGLGDVVDPGGLRRPDDGLHDDDGMTPVEGVGGGGGNGGGQVTKFFLSAVPTVASASGVQSPLGPKVAQARLRRCGLMAGRQRHPWLGSPGRRRL